MKKPLRHSPLINVLDGRPDFRKSDQVPGHVFHGNHGIFGDGSKTISTGLGPKPFNHAGILSALDVRLGKFCPRRSDIRRLHIGVVVDESRDITRQISRILSHEAGQVMNEFGEDAIPRDGILAVCGTKVDRWVGRVHRNDEWESGSEVLEVEPNPIFWTHVSSIHSRRAIFWDEIVVDGVYVGPRVLAVLPAIEVERRDPLLPVLIQPWLLVS